jgi:hypothetical protein
MSRLFCYTYANAHYEGYFRLLADNIRLHIYTVSIYSLWNSFQASCCQGGVCDFLSSSDQCRDVLEEVYNMIYDHGLNLYNIISQCNEYTPPDLQWEWAEVQYTLYICVTNLSFVGGTRSFISYVVCR